MKILLFGSSGMVGQGVLRVCLLADDVEQVLAVVRTPGAARHPKLRELVCADMFALPPIEAGYDACFFCLGVSSVGMSEADYTRGTYDLTLAIARRLDPGMTFIYVSGTHTDSSEHGGSMWARVKGRTENALFALPFRAKFMFRPGYIQPMHGMRSRTRLYRLLYAVARPFYPAIKALFPRYATTTENVGRAMLEVARHGAPKNLLENADINALSG